MKTYIVKTNKREIKIKAKNEEDLEQKLNKKIQDWEKYFMIYTENNIEV